MKEASPLYVFDKMTLRCIICFVPPEYVLIILQMYIVLRLHQNRWKRKRELRLNSTNFSHIKKVQYVLEDIYVNGLNVIYERILIS
jgi:hypothetical protein